MSAPLNLSTDYQRDAASDAMRARYTVRQHTAPAFNVPRRQAASLARMSLEAVALGVGLSSLVWLMVLAIALTH